MVQPDGVSTLRGFTIGITGDRRADEQAELLGRRGALVVHGPMIETRPLADSPELKLACEALVATPPEVLVATTGVGIRSWMEAADGLGVGDGLRASLAGAEVLARSPKAAGALLTAGLPLHWQADGEQTRDVIEHLEHRDLRGVRVAVQRDGSTEPRLAEALAERGAVVVDVPIYRWTLPSDREPALKLLDALVDRRLDAITVTSAALAGDVLVACVGPVCAARAREAGVTRIVQPSRFRLGSMVRGLADHLAARRWALTADGHDLEVQGGLAVVDGHEVDRTRREQLVLARLRAAEGGVVAKAELARAWPAAIDPHVVEVTVGRLRTRLGAAAGAVVTVPRRGYRLSSPPRPAGAVT